jgi:tetratricopeptide (TPR) repeat protein
MKKITIIAGLFFGVLWGIYAQTETDMLLANEYYGQGEYEKALVLYEKMAKKQQFAYDIHKNYLDILLKLQKFDEAEKYKKSKPKIFLPKAIST